MAKSLGVAHIRRLIDGGFCSHSNNRRFFHELSLIIRNQSTKNLAMRAFAQERQSKGNIFSVDECAEESSTLEFAAVADDDYHPAGSPDHLSQQHPQDDKIHKQKSSKSDNNSAGQTPTPSLHKQMSTRDFINSQREERLNSAEGLKLNTE